MYAVNTTTEIPITRETSITDACLCHDNMGTAESFRKYSDGATPSPRRVAVHWHSI